MSIRQRIGALVAALLLVEVASYWKLTHFLAWTNEPWLAYVSGLAFIGLLLASIVALGSDIPQSIRKQFYVGGVWLFIVQALANVLQDYQLGLSILPVEVVTGFFGVGSDLALKAMATIQGATLSVVSISFWSVLGQMLKSLSDERKERRAQLERLQQMMEGTTK